MAEHTPGPWSVGYTRQSTTDPRIGPFWQTNIHVGEHRNRGNVLAVAHMGGKGATDISREAVEANARLIAAAPDLLEACRANAEFQMGFLSSSDDIVELAEKCRRLTAAAIAKATGKEGVA